MSILGLSMPILEPITVACTDDVKSSLGPIELHESKVEQGSDHNSGDCEGAEEPGEPLLDVNRDKSKVDSGSDGDLELGEGHDERLHLLWSLGERVLQ